MNSLRNSVQLIGRLGTDPEVKTFDKDRKIVKFRLATSDVYAPIRTRTAKPATSQRS